MRVSQRHDLARASLLALATPIGISSVALLILNDHVLKHIAPSAITDKLGDFAGLMFAPYVLLLAIGMLPVRFDRGHQRRVAQAAYVVVGTFFFALKASSVSAPVLVALLDIAVPGPVAIVVDPTDLIALVVLPGSYLMWIRAWSCMSPAVMFRVRQTTVAAFGVFALVATSQPQPWITSTAADSTDPETMYAVLRYTVADGLYKTDNAGRTWTRLTAVTGDLVTDPARPGRVYVLAPDSWNPRVLRLERGAREPTDIGPPSPGKRPQVVYVHGPDILLPVPWSADLVLLAKNGDLLRTTDSGAIWQSYGFLGSVQALTYASGPRVIYLATEDALLRSDDGGDRWTDVSRLPGKPATIAASASGDVLLAGIGKDLMRSRDGGRTWYTVFHYSGGGDANFARWQLGFDPRDESRAYLLFGFGCCAAMFSANGGNTWEAWGQPIADLAIGATVDHPLIATTSYMKSVLRLDSAAPGTWIDVGASLPVR